jgi:hypothetical protein
MINSTGTNLISSLLDHSSSRPVLITLGKSQLMDEYPPETLDEDDDDDEDDSDDDENSDSFPLKKKQEKAKWTTDEVSSIFLLFLFKWLELIV